MGFSTSMHLNLTFCFSITWDGGRKQVYYPLSVPLLHRPRTNRIFGCSWKVNALLRKKLSSSYTDCMRTKYQRSISEDLVKKKRTRLNLARGHLSVRSSYVLVLQGNSDLILVYIPHVALESKFLISSQIILLLFYKCSKVTL